MKDTEIISELGALLKGRAPVVSRHQEVLKRQLFQKIQLNSRQEREKELLDALNLYQSFPSVSQIAAVKQRVMNTIDYTRQPDWGSTVLGLLHTLFKRGLVSSFALVFVFALVYGPLQLFRTVQDDTVLPYVQAAYLDCFGRVYINDRLCDSNLHFRVEPGDQIRTTKNSAATVVFSDYSVIRLQNNTKAQIDQTQRDQFNLQEGSIWVQNPTSTQNGGTRVTTPVLKAHVPQGGVGITARNKVTELHTTSASVELQISNKGGATEVVTVSPEKSVMVRSLGTKSRINEQQLVAGQDWVTENQAKDLELLQEVKQKTVAETLVGAGELPGTLKDSVSKVTHSIETALTWDNEEKLHMQIAEIDELFSESLVLQERGDHDAAANAFSLYRSKFLDLISRYSTVMSLGATSTDNPLVAAFQRHSRLASPFTLVDPQYVLKESLQDLSVSLASLGDSQSQEVIAKVSNEKLLEARQVVSDGNITQAEMILRNTAAIGNINPSTSSSINNSSLLILDDIARQSEELQPLVTEIRFQKLNNIRSIEPVGTDQEYVGRMITGTAYKEIDQDGLENTTSQTTVKVVGQAVKDE
ncbi:MAG: FecR domain-containing protein [bacterium]|nr:FecR domain-containing protein [bacterium]